MFEVNSAGIGMDFRTFFGYKAPAISISRDPTRPCLGSHSTYNFEDI